MKKNLKHLDREQKRELYLMANRDPWLVWRLKALESGYLPPLLPGKIPPELARETIGSLSENYDIDTLVEHAERYQSKQKVVLRRTFTILVTLFILFTSVALYVYVSMGSNFEVGLIQAIMQNR